MKKYLFLVVTVLIFHHSKAQFKKLRFDDNTSTNFLEYNNIGQLKLGAYGDNGAIGKIFLSGTRNNLVYGQGGELEFAGGYGTRANIMMKYTGGHEQTWLGITSSDSNYPLRVGIGTNSPKTNMEIYDYAVSSHLRVHTNQHAGIAKLEIAGGSAYLDSDPNNYSGWSIYHSYVNTNRSLYFRHGETGEPSFVLSANGSVGIGIISPDPAFALSVNGSIRSKEVKVEANWPDFVFYDNYQLRTLEEVEEHITEKGHLPEIPNEAEVTENGINLGEMNAKLLQKIEELTLYMIEMNKEMKSQNERVEQLEIQNAELKNKVQLLENQ